MSTSITSEKTGKVVKSEDEWRKQLTPEQYHVTCEHGTERADAARAIVEVLGPMVTEARMARIDAVVTTRGEIARFLSGVRKIRRA